MNRLRVLGAMAILVMAVSMTSVLADDPAPATDAKATVAQTTCPIMGGAINKKLYVDHDGKRIYVCCGGCIAEIKSDPAKIIAKLEAAGVTLDKTPVAEKDQASCPHGADCGKCPKKDSTSCPANKRNKGQCPVQAKDKDAAGATE